MPEYRIYSAETRHVYCTTRGWFYETADERTEGPFVDFDDAFYFFTLECEQLSRVS